MTKDADEKRKYQHDWYVKNKERLRKKYQDMVKAGKAGVRSARNNPEHDFINVESKIG